MAKTPLTAGYNIIINQKVNGENTPIYPFTKTANIKDAEGNTLDDIIAGLALKEHGNHVPDFISETVSGIRFLRNDNTWATIQNATTEQKGIVKLSNDINLDDGTVAATAKAVKNVKDAIDVLSGTSIDNFIQKTQLGVATAGGVTGVATLDEAGLVPANQLPSFVDDVLEVKMDANLTKAYSDAKGTKVIEPETGKIYVDCIGDNATEKTYRWSGTRFAVISDTITLGETSTTAYRGDLGKIAYEHSRAEHARVDATRVDSSEKNGYVKINGAESLVYTHPGSGTNPHGTTAADVGLGKVENKTSEEIRAELTSGNVTTALGYTPANVAALASASQNGIMSSTYAAKLDNCMQSAVSTEDPSFTSGLWFQIVE